MKEKYRNGFDQCLNFLSILSNCAALHILITIFCYKDPFVKGFLIWSLLTLGSISLILLLTGTRLQRLIIGVFFLPMAVMAVYTSRFGNVPERLIGWSALLLMWSVPTIRYCIFLYSAPKPESRENDFLFILMTLLVAAGLMSTDSFDSSIMIPQLIGLLFALLQLVLLRSGGHKGMGKWMKSIGLMIIPAGVIGAVWIFFCVLVPSLIKVQMQVEHTGLFVLSTIGKFLGWLISLIPVKEEAAALLPDKSQAFAATVGVAEVAVVNDILLMLGAILIAAVVLILLLFLLRQIRLPNRTHGENMQIKSQMSLGLWLKDLIIRFKQKIFKKIWLLKYRNTPQGYYLYLEQHYRHLGKGRKMGETSREFLERLAEQETDADIKQKYMQLAEWMEKKLWGIK